MVLVTKSRGQELPNVDRRTVGFAFEDLRRAKLRGATGKLQLGVDGGGHASHAKIRDLGHAPGHQNVLRLEVTMNHPPARQVTALHTE